MNCDLFDLSGRVALVTGGSRGLGFAMSRGFVECGADVMICSRNEEDLQLACEKIREGLSDQCKIEYMVCDVSDRQQVDDLAVEALNRMGKVDILVNNAGMNCPDPIDQVQDELWDQVLEVNLTSAMRLTRAIVPQMKERKWGRVIHISSVLGKGSKPARNSYSSTKAALIAMAKASALDLGEYGVTVNCICPGPFLTDMPLRVMTEEQKQAFTDITALKRWGEPRELAGPAIFLASEAGSYVTGEALLVDGGVYARTL